MTSKFSIEWKKKDFVQCFPRYGSFDTLSSAQAQCEKDADCTNVINIRCYKKKTKEYHLCSRSSELQRWTTSCAYSKPGKIRIVLVFTNPNYLMCPSFDE